MSFVSTDRVELFTICSFERISQKKNIFLGSVCTCRDIRQVLSLLLSLISKKLDVIQRISSRIITNSPAQSHSAPFQLMLGLDALYHVIPLVGKIVSERTHPYVLTTLVLLLTLMVLLLLIASAEALITRDLSRFGIRILSKSAMKQRTVAHSSPRALEMVLGDISLIQGFSLTSYRA